MYVFNESNYIPFSNMIVIGRELSRWFHRTVTVVIWRGRYLWNRNIWLFYLLHWCSPV